MTTQASSASPLDITVRLEWTVPSAPNSDCHYDHCISETPFGRFLLTWKSWKDYPDYGFDETPWGDVEYHGWTTVDEAQEWAKKEMESRIRDCFKANVELNGEPLAASPAEPKA